MEWVYFVIIMGSILAVGLWIGWKFAQTWPIDSPGEMKLVQVLPSASKLWRDSMDKLHEKMNRPMTRREFDSARAMAGIKPDRFEQQKRELEQLQDKILKSNKRLDELIGILTGFVDRLDRLLK